MSKGFTFECKTNLNVWSEHSFYVKNKGLMRIGEEVGGLRFGAGGW